MDAAHRDELIAQSLKMQEEKADHKKEENEREAAIFDQIKESIALATQKKKDLLYKQRQIFHSANAALQEERRQLQDLESEHRR